MSITEGELQFGDVSELAHKIREAIGVGDFETVECILPQFDRTDGRTVSIAPPNAEWLDSLKNAPLKVLADLGLQCWDKNLWLFPAEWYDYIPEGYEVVDINDETEPFHKGISDDDSRGGALPYGILSSVALKEVKP